MASAKYVGKNDRDISIQEEKNRMIAEAAYYKAEHRGFQGEAQVDDWLGAEKEIEAILKKIGKSQKTSKAA